MVTWTRFSRVVSSALRNIAKEDTTPPLWRHITLILRSVTLVPISLPSVLQTGSDHFPPTLSTLPRPTPCILLHYVAIRVGGLWILSLSTTALVLTFTFK